MNSCEFVTFISAVACSLTNCYSKDELSLLAAVFSQLGDTLATILTREEICCRDDDKGSDSKGVDEAKAVKRQGGDSAETQKENASGRE